MPKEWPLTRKGKKYVVVSRQRNGIPLLIVLRDMLKLGRTRKEIKKILNEGNVAVNGKMRKDLDFFNHKKGFYLPWIWKSHNGIREEAHWFDSLGNLLMIDCMTTKTFPAQGVVLKSRRQFLPC